MEGVHVELTERDLIILRTIAKWRWLLSRHIKEFVGFTSSRTLDRRLKLLVENKYINRKKVLYGIPYIYTLAHKSRVLLCINKKGENIKIDNIYHNIKVLDCVTIFIKRYNLSMSNIQSEKDLHTLDGFSSRRHHPDFVFEFDDKSYAVEIEITLKATERLENNVKNNFINFDEQIWIIEKNNNILNKRLINLKSKYNLQLYYLEELGSDRI